MSSRRPCRLGVCIWDCTNVITCGAAERCAKRIDRRRFEEHVRRNEAERMAMSEAMGYAHEPGRYLMVAGHVTQLQRPVPSLRSVLEEINRDLDGHGANDEDESRPHGANDDGNATNDDGPAVNDVGPAANDDGPAANDNDEPRLPGANVDRTRPPVPDDDGPAANDDGPAANDDESRSPGLDNTEPHPPGPVDDECRPHGANDDDVPDRADSPDRIHYLSNIDGYLLGSPAITGEELWTEWTEGCVRDIRRRWRFTGCHECRMETAYGPGHSGGITWGEGYIARMPADDDSTYGIRRVCSRHRFGALVDSSVAAAHGNVSDRASPKFADLEQIPDDVAPQKTAEVHYDEVSSFHCSSESTITADEEAITAVEEVIILSDDELDAEAMPSAESVATSTTREARPMATRIRRFVAKRCRNAVRGIRRGLNVISCGTIRRGSRPKCSSPEVVAERTEVSGGKASPKDLMSVLQLINDEIDEERDAGQGALEQGTDGGAVRPRPASW